MSAILAYNDQERFITSLEEEYIHITTHAHHTHSIQLQQLMDEISEVLKKHYAKFFEENIQRLNALLHRVFASIYRDNPIKE